MTHAVITLRARWCLHAPQPGELLAAPTGGVVLRVEAVTTLRQAGAHPGSHRYRLTCTRLPPADVPPDAMILPMPKASHAPRQTPLQAAPMPWVAPMVPKHTQGRPGGSVRRTEAHAGGDFGPVLRRKAMRDRRGRLLREPDVEVDEGAGDPRYPNRKVRRAYRVDTIERLFREGTTDPKTGKPFVGRREVEAAGDLRKYLERVTPSVGGGGLTRVGIAPHLCQPITDTHLRAARKLREASAALGERLWGPVLWVCLGGSVRGYAAQWHVGTNRASALVGAGLARLGDHFYGRAA